LIVGFQIVLTDVLLLITEHLDDALTELVVGDLDIILGVTVILHEGEEVIVGDVELERKRVSLHAQEGRSGVGRRGRATYELVLLAADLRDVHVVGGGREILELLAGEDIDGDKVDLGVTVLASLGGGHVDDLAGTALDNDVTVLTQSRALHGVGGRSASIGGFEGNIVLFILLAYQCHLVQSMVWSEGRGGCVAWCTQ
jgi:hypothetical protein